MSTRLDSTSTPTRRSAMVVAGLSALAAVGLIVPNIAGANGPANPTAHPRPADRALDVQPADRVEPGDVLAGDLGRVELGDLADELDRLGLELTITPVDTPAVPTDTATDSGESTADPTVGTDPFEGMTDEQIDALSDEEFFARLEAAGIDPVTDEVIDGGGQQDQPDAPQDVGDYGDDETPLASFPIEGGTLISADRDPTLANQAEAIWNRFTTLIPADQRTMVSGFELMSEAYGGAHVYAADDDPTRWILGVGLGMSGDELDYVLVHEFGHLLTLQASEVPPSDDAETCTTYDPGEGCALSHSTLAEFVDAFWPQSMRDEVERLAMSQDWAAIDDFYQRNADRFVTDYATTNPVEDLAETFAAFVLEDRPVGDTIADQKVQMLWADADMVALREQIRSSR